MTGAQPRPLGSRYELLDLLGTGAMGEVWRARDRESDRELAAKVLRSELARDTEIVTRFIQERSILMGLRHPNIVRVHDLVVEGERLGILMDLIEGGDLRGRLRAEGTLGRREAVGAAAAVLDALAEAHSQGCLHRDVKPDNVLLAGDVLDDGAVKLSDFSIARLAQESTVMATGLLGTPSYMPPELFVHGQFSAASDVYATGVLLYELLAGRTPFAGSGTAHTIGNRHVTADPPRLPVEDELWHLLVTMLAKDPRVRLTAAGTAQALRDLPGPVLDGMALPVQGNPDTFGPALETSLRAGPIRVQGTPADLDPGLTNVHAGRVAETPLAATGEVQAFGAAPPLADAELTSVGRAAPVHHAPVLTPGAVREPEKHRKSWRPWLIGGLVLLALGGGGVAFAATRDDDGSLTGPDASPSAGQVPVVTDAETDQALPSGLTVARAVEYDPASNQLQLTITYTTQDAPLAGPFYEAIPAADDASQCPSVVWEGRDQLPTDERNTGIKDPCGFAVEVGTIPEDSSEEVTATVDIDLGDDPDAVRDWLAKAATATATDLESEFVIEPRFAAQRLSDVLVDVQPGITTRSRNIRVRLLPVWLDGSVDRVSPIFDSLVTGAPTSVLQQVAGGYSGVKLDDACGGALSIVDNRQVSALRQADNCQVEAEVGNYQVESPPFTISFLGG